MFWGLVILMFGGYFSYVWWLRILTFPVRFLTFGGL